MRALGEWIRKFQNIELYSEVVIFLMMCASMELLSLYLPLQFDLKEISLWFLMCAAVNQVMKGLKWKRIFVTVSVMLVIVLYIFLHKYGMNIEILIGIMWYPMLKLINSREFVGKIYTFLLVGLLVAGWILDEKLQKNVIAIILLLLLKEIIGIRNSEKGLRLFPVLLLMELFILMIPVSNKPFDWTFVITMGRKIETACRDFVSNIDYMMKDNLEFGDMNAGYSGEGEFGGEIFDSNKEELYVSSKSTVQNMYISGSVFSTLDGAKWKKTSSEEPYGIWLAKYLNTLYQNGITREEAYCFSKICRTELTYGYLKTDSVFHNTYNLTMRPSVANEMTENYGDFQFQSIHKKEFSYPLIFLDFDYSNEYLRDILYQSAENEDIEWAGYYALDDYCYELYNYYLNEILTKDEYYDFVNNNGEMINASDYVTNDASDRVKKLAIELTEGKTSDYEKALAIEDYLRKNYTYSKAADNSNAEDVIDYFLFESKTGYCMHYASAMVILLQLNDIPARYVEGYLCDYSNQRVDNGSYYLTAGNSHAWPEAYIEGFGWVRFEPTSVYDNGATTGWNREVGGGQKIPQREIFTSEEDTEEIPEQAPVKAKTKKKKGKSTGEVLGSAVTFIVLFAVILCVIYLVRRKEVYRHKGEIEKLEAQLKDMEWLISRIYPGSWDNRPLLDYVSVIEEKELQEQFEKICYMYYRARYGKNLFRHEEWDMIFSGKEKLYNRFLQLEKRGKLQRKWIAFWRLEAPIQ